MLVELASDLLHGVELGLVGRHPHKLDFETLRLLHHSPGSVVAVPVLDKAEAAVHPFPQPGEEAYGRLAFRPPARCGEGPPLG